MKTKKTLSLTLAAAMTAGWLRRWRRQLQHPCRFQ